MVVDRDPVQSNARRGQPTSAGLALEDHGRAITTNIQAAAFYRQAQRAADTSRTVTAPGTRSAPIPPSSSLSPISMPSLETPLSAIGGRPMNWERHHIEVVRTAASGNLGRSADLLREHLASVGCDPVALRIVTELRRRAGRPGGLDDLTGHLPACHPGSKDTHRERLP